MKFSVGQLFSGIRGTGTLGTLTIERNDPQGWAVTLWGDRERVRIQSRSMQDGSFIEKLQQRYRVSVGPQGMAGQDLGPDLMGKWATRLEGMRERAVMGAPEELPVASFLRGWDWVKDAVGRDHTRANLRGVYVDAGQMVATDGYRLHLYGDAFPTTYAGNPLRSFVWPASNIGMVAAAIQFNHGSVGGHTTYAVGRDHMEGTVVEVVTSGSELHLEALFSTAEQFPDYTMLRPSPRATDALLVGNAEELREALRRIPALQNGKDRSRALTLREDGLWAMDTKGQQTTQRLPVTVQVSPRQPFKIWLTDAYLLDVLREEGDFSLRLTDELGPLVYEAGPRVGLLMPRRG